MHGNGFLEENLSLLLVLVQQVFVIFVARVAFIGLREVVLILDQLLHFLLKHGELGLFAYLLLLLFKLNDTVLACIFVFDCLFAVHFALGAFATFFFLLD